MKLKKLISVFLVGGMAVGLLAGCGSTKETAGVSASEEGQTSAEEELEEEDLATIELYAMTMYSSDGVEEVEDAINEISEKEIGVHVNITLLDMAAYAEQVGLKFAGQEQMDLILTTPIASAGFTSLVSQNQLTPLNELLPEYAPELYELMEDYLDGTTVSGNIYSVSAYRLMNTSCYMIMRKDILDDLGLTEKAENLNSWTEYQEIAQAIVDSGYDGNKVSTILSNNDSNGTVLSPEYAMTGNEFWADNYGYDSLGDTYKIIAVDETTDTVYDYFESEAYYNMLKISEEMYNKGYIYKDASTSDESGDTLMENDVTFSIVKNSETGVEQSMESSTGYEVVCSLISEEPISTGSTTKFTWAVPVTAKEPEAAVKFMNLMYTNADIENLFVWGIEGRDYELNDENEAVRLEDAVYKSGDFLWGNQFLAYPAEGQGSDFRAEGESAMKEAAMSKYFGCSIDTTEIANEITAVYNVIEQYAVNYESGSVSAPDTYEEYLESDFVKALESAGVQKILDAYQTQLDEWLAQQ